MEKYDNIPYKSLEVYISSYDKRIKKYLQSNIELKNIDFIKREVENIIRHLNFMNEPLELISIEDVIKVRNTNFQILQHRKKRVITYNRIIEYLEEKSLVLGFELDVNNFEKNKYWKFSLRKNKTLPLQKTPDQEATKPELTLKQVALLYIYNGDQITRENGNSIAERYGHKSGENLYQRYNEYALSTDRNSSGSKRKDKNLLKDIEKVISYLPKEKQEKPKNEADKLRNTIQNDNYPSS